MKKKFEPQYDMTPSKLYDACIRAGVDASSMELTDDGVFFKHRDWQYAVVKPCRIRFIDDESRGFHTTILSRYLGTFNNVDEVAQIAKMRFPFINDEDYERVRDDPYRDIVI